MTEHLVPFEHELWLSLQIQAAKIRRSWIFQVFFPMLISFGTIWLGSRLAEVNGLSVDTQTRYVTGATFVAAMFGTFNVVTSETSWARESGELEYFISAGVNKISLVISYISLPIIYSILPICVTIWIGCGLMKLHPHFGPLLLPVILSGQLSMTCAGAALGFTLPRRPAMTIAAGLPVLIMLFTPVLVPTGAVPSPLRAFGQLLPSTLMVDLIQVSLFGQPGWLNLIEAGGLLCLAAVSLFLVSQMRAWRGRS
jgi:hypothetical protein